MTDLTSLTSLKTYLNVSGTSNDAQLIAIISGVSRRIETDCQRTFGATNWIEYQNTGQRQMRAQIRNKPVITLTSVRWGYQTAIQVQVNSNFTGIWSAIQITQNPRNSDKSCIVTSMSSTGGTYTSTFNLTTSAYQTCSQLVAGINTLPGFTATLLGGIDVPTRWLYPWTTNLKSYNNFFVQALGFPYIDLFGYVIDVEYGTIGFQPLSSIDYYFGGGPSVQYGGGFPVSFPGMYQGLCLDYRGGYETIPDDITLLANQVCQEVFYESQRNPALTSESLADYSYTAADPLLRRNYYADQLAAYRRVAIAGGMG